MKELLKIENDKISIKLYFEKGIKMINPNIHYLDSINNVQNLVNVLRVFRDKDYEINREFDLKNCILLTSKK